MLRIRQNTKASSTSMKYETTASEEMGFEDNICANLNLKNYKQEMSFSINSWRRLVACQNWKNRYCW